MKILFVISSYVDYRSGISKKILSQVEALKKSGLEVDLCHYSIEKGIRYWALNGKNIAKIGKGIIAYLRYFYYYSPILKLASNYDGVYIRYVHNASPFFMRFLNRLKKEKKTIIMEIPTFPYDGEYVSVPLWMKLPISIEKLSRCHFRKYIDRIVTFSTHSYIYGVRTINLSNAIDFNKIVLQPVKSASSDVRLCGVANLMFWHGFDRLILGLKDYYNSHPLRRVTFDIVGGGELRDQLESLSKDLGLSEVINFHGLLSGSKLDLVINQADICIGCLGCHRKNIREVKSLKNVEYAARGIPFIYSEENDDFDHQEYVYKIPPDESHVNIFEILDWYDKLSLMPNEIRDSISNLSWDFQMSKVTNYYKQISYEHD